jgi:hypothetical protein
MHVVASLFYRMVLCVVKMKRKEMCDKSLKKNCMISIFMIDYSLRLLGKGATKYNPFHI